MFTGLVEEVGTVERRRNRADGAVLTIAAKLAGDLKRGDSVAVDGACLTATEVEPGQPRGREGLFTAEVMNLTLRRTTLGERAVGDRVNLELAARIGDRLGGHIVQGHIDDAGALLALTEDGFARRARFAVVDDVLRYVVERGSIAVNGVSLTVAAKGDAWFEVSLIPETLERTNLGLLEVGDRVNVECDVIARYVESFTRTPSSPPTRENGQRETG